ncbi:RNA polymerase, sigma subunit, ECF family [Massilia sp. PDC64]|nr:sigma-70 family RNA polymerase sigma factor [Massilia sp. PDC64]SDC71602.1 RNA polymerase, sigma subunit, ECF family [Massilia sp. PDC64]
MTGAASAVLAVDLDRLRPRLHRYCARMVGSALDGEDIVQDALVRALEASAPERPVDNPEGWLFRIAHNLALDLLRRRARTPVTADDDGVDALADTNDEEARRDAAAASLPAFMRLPPAQRGAVILFDVLDYSAEEVGAILGTTVPAVKSALQRGRGRLRELASQPGAAIQPALPDAERRLLQRYVDLFNARDFDALREMLAADVRLDLVNRLRLQGRAVGEYFTRYGQAPGWKAWAGIVEGRPAVLIRSDGQPDYFAVLAWSDGRVATIRDFLFARYVMDESCHFTVIER